MRDIAFSVYQEQSARSLYGVGSVPFHTHNGIDSPMLATSAAVQSPVNGRSHNPSSTTVGSGSNVKMLLSANDFANGITWDAANSRFVVVTAGAYMMSYFITFLSVISGSLYQAQLYKNGSAIGQSDFVSGGSSVNVTAGASDIQQLAVGDYIELYAFQSSGSSVTVKNGIGTYLALALT